MASLAARYGVKLNLSGHLHIQHIAREDGLADAALGAFCIWPHRYALVTAGDDGSLVYEARELDSRFLPEGFSGDEPGMVRRHHPVKKPLPPSPGRRTRSE
jgi:hypothetical protein